LAGPSLISGISYSNPFINRGSNASSGSGEVIYELPEVTIEAERLGNTDGPIAGSGRMIEPIWWGDRNFATNSVYRASQNTQNIWGRAIFDVASTIAPLPKIGWAVRGLRALRGGSKVKYIGRLEDLRGISRNQTFLGDLPNLGSPKANYYQNMSVLRKAIRDGYKIKDASRFRPNSQLAPTLLRPNRTIGQTFLGAERLLLKNRGLWP